MIQKRVEATPVAGMGERLGPLDVVGSRASLLGDRKYAVSRHIEKLRLRLDEAADQPRTGDAIDLGVFACDPLHRPSPRTSLLRRVVWLCQCSHSSCYEW